VKPGRPADAHMFRGGVDPLKQRDVKRMLTVALPAASSTIGAASTGSAAGVALPAASSTIGAVLTGSAAGFALPAASSTIGAVNRVSRRSRLAGGVIHDRGGLNRISRGGRLAGGVIHDRGGLNRISRRGLLFHQVLQNNLLLSLSRAAMLFRKAADQGLDGERQPRQADQFAGGIELFARLAAMIPHLSRYFSPPKWRPSVQTFTSLRSTPSALTQAY
jgi:hypothetical protein